MNEKNSEVLIRLLINQDMNFIKQWEDINYVDEKFIRNIKHIYKNFPTMN